MTKYEAKAVFEEPVGIELELPDPFTALDWVTYQNAYKESEEVHGVRLVQLGIVKGDANRWIHAFAGTLAIAKVATYQGEKITMSAPLDVVTAIGVYAEVYIAQRNAAPKLKTSDRS